MIQARIQITGLQKAMDQLGAMNERLKDLSPALQEAGEYLMDFFSNDVYASEGGVYNEPWAALSPAYAAKKLKKWGPRPILIASGKMSRSYSLMVASDYLIISNDATNDRGDYYAGYHQEGTSKMPRRVVMKFQEEQLNKVADIVVKHINSILEGSL